MEFFALVQVGVIIFDTRVIYFEPANNVFHASRKTTRKRVKRSEIQGRMRSKREGMESRAC